MRDDQDNLAQSAYLFYQQYDLAFDLLKAEFAEEVALIQERQEAAFILRCDSCAYHTASRTCTASAYAPPLRSIL